MEEENTCQCQPHGFGKGTYRLSFLLLVFLILTLLFAVGDIKKEIKELNNREEKRDYTIQDGTEIFNRIGEYSEQVNNRKMTKEEKIQKGKIEHMRLKPGETSHGLTKEDIKRMLKFLGYW